MNNKLEYSDKKIKINFPLLYSVLNPETNSDSLSDKSKGVRLISAIILINKIIIIGKNKILNQIYFLYIIILLILNELINIKIIKIEIEKIIS